MKMRRGRSPSFAIDPILQPKLDVREDEIDVEQKRSNDLPLTHLRGRRGFNKYL